MKFLKDLLKYRRGALVLYSYDLIGWRIRLATKKDRNDILSKYTVPTRYLIQKHQFTNSIHIKNCEKFMSDLPKIMMVLFHENSLNGKEESHYRVHNFFASSDKIKNLMKNAATNN